ncbi:uncharacterized protein (DUF302 family) [Hydrogenivirga caldilitoris]|uniref:Uncharacterized protein (DUF302 family) n=1 Tax=Hydrogenivirga caldilitoris TaxID=246264 RepID=A0A497XR15_9AQUI|nr:DUF302 domain-containing protein [Hydrogenivirga caldilitoris]RLJ71447.1 uncharacterized protein (DUF302 family) [Hydrogenivirga caldilitoris]
MRAILFLVGGLVAVLAFIFYVKTRLITPENMFFFTLEVKGKENQREVVEKLVKKLNEKGLNVIRTLPMSDVIHERGSKDFPNYTTVLACDIKEKKELLRKVPFMSVLIPCSVAVYEKGGKVYITSMKEVLLIRDYATELGDKDSQLIADVYQRLRIAIAEVAEGEKR